MTLNYIHELYNEKNRISDFIYKNSPELKNEVQDAENKKEKIEKQISIAEAAMALQNHKIAQSILQENGILFNNAQDYDEIDFDKIESDIAEITRKEKSIIEFKEEIESQEEKFTGLLKEQEEFYSVAGKINNIINYFNSLNPEIVSQIYEKKQEFIKAVKTNYQMNTALEVAPKGVFEKIKYTLTKNKREKEAKLAADRVNSIRSEIENMAKQLPQATSVGEKWQDSKMLKQDPAYKELNDLGITFNPPNIDSYLLIGNSIQEAKSLNQQAFYESDEFKNAQAKYFAELYKVKMNDSQLQTVRSQLTTQRHQLQQGQADLKRECMLTLGTESTLEANSALKQVKNNLKTAQEVENITAFLKEPENNSVLEEMENQIKKENTQENIEPDKIEK